ncbi:MAG: hypothetical protein AVDCRST_MAG96-1687 [uncultured Segetibacter sp.]|uniref:Uncharacterized protein n=1 Tax=uncultured Segetibacter sp. TaxID=481133 RepID=A0A6J4SC00_9BACT|nr:MAG: hypothetical protein AVDCRST_MAG96-1687 [uncultured Segetibacter sp.]
METIKLKNKMKAIRVHDFERSILSLALVLFIVFSLPSCARKFAFSTSPVVPAAEGSVKVKKSKNDNYKIELKVIRLADPKRLEPPKESYVVWMQTEHNGTKNIGQLKTSTGFLSKTLKSSLETVTSFKPAGFFITAENNANIQNPGGRIVLKTSPS